MKTSSQLKVAPRCTALHARATPRPRERALLRRGLDKEGLRKKAYKENAVGRWEELHPEKKAKPRRAAGGGGGGMPDFGGGKAPDGMDPL
eukprot:5592054-Prymnesium_polylepis.1